MKRNQYQDDMLKDWMKQIEDAEDMLRCFKANIPEKEVITYRITSNSLRDRIKVAWKILTTGQVTIRISHSKTK